jgi:hypothetical protein
MRALQGAPRSDAGTAGAVRIRLFSDIQVHETLVGMWKWYRIGKLEHIKHRGTS